MTNLELFAQVKAEYSLTSDYQLARKLGISDSRLYTYKKRGSALGDDVALNIENLLNLPEGSLLFEVKAQQTKCKKAAEIMHELSKKLMATAAALFLTFSTGYGSFSNEATASPISQKIAYSVYYVKSATLLLIRLFFRPMGDITHNPFKAFTF